MAIANSRYLTSYSNYDLRAGHQAHHIARSFRKSAVLNTGAYISMNDNATIHLSTNIRAWRGECAFRLSNIFPGLARFRMLIPSDRRLLNTWEGTWQDVIPPAKRNVRQNPSNSQNFRLNCARLPRAYSAHNGTIPKQRADNLAIIASRRDLKLSTSPTPSPPSS